jgi:hypothetical protein
VLRRAQEENGTRRSIIIKFHKCEEVSTNTAKREGEGEKERGSGQKRGAVCVAKSGTQVTHGADECEMSPLF